MRVSRCRIPFAFVVFPLLCIASLQGQAQEVPREQLAATPVEQLGNEGMRAAGEAWSAWLQAEVARAVSGGNRLLVTHGPNLSAAFPEYSRNMGEGEAFIFAPGGSQGPRLVHRIRIEDWTGL